MPGPRRPYQMAEFKKEAKRRAVPPCIILRADMCRFGIQLHACLHPDPWLAQQAQLHQDSTSEAPLSRDEAILQSYCCQEFKPCPALYPKTCQQEDSKADTSTVLSFLFSWTRREEFRGKEGRNILGRKKKKKKLAVEAAAERKAACPWDPPAQWVTRYCMCCRSHQVLLLPAW